MGVPLCQKCSDPASELAGRAVLFLWATNPKLTEAMKVIFLPFALAARIEAGLA
jgi:hypothetical protein